MNTGTKLMVGTLVCAMASVPGAAQASPKSTESLASYHTKVVKLRAKVFRAQTRTHVVHLKVHKPVTWEPRKLSLQAAWLAKVYANLRTLPTWWGDTPREMAKNLTEDRFPGQFPCLDWIIKHESNYQVTVWNHSGSGAYGIPQALPGNKMAVFGRDWMTNPVTQLRWMVMYVASKYGSPCGAMAYWRANNSY